MSVTPSTLDVQSAQIAGALGDVHTCMPCEVLRVHEGAHKRQFVDVLPGLQRAVYNEDSELVDETLPIIQMVPVAILQGGGFFVSLPLHVGDIVLVLFAERSIDQWIETAKKGSKRAVVPGDVSTHPLEGAIALPCGPAPRSALLEGVSNADLVIGTAAGPAMRIGFDGAIRLAEGDGEEGIALGLKTNAELADLKHQVAAIKLDLDAGFGAVTALGGKPAIETARGLAATAAEALPPWGGSVAASKVTAR